MNKTIIYLLGIFFLVSCNNQKPKNVVSKENKKVIIDTISGFYKTEIDTRENDMCDLSIRIFKVKNDYNFHLKTNLRNVKGKVGFGYDESKEVYLVFEGVKWDEYRGDISNELDDDENNDEDIEELELPNKVEALLGKDTLSIQNTGNSMNYYTKIGECGRKYIYLIKQNHH